MGNYTKKPVTIEAFRWTGGPDQPEDPDWICDVIVAGTVNFAHPGTADVAMLVSTPEGIMTARPGDWIIRGVEGEIYPCKDSVFQATYAAASRAPDASGDPAITLAEAQAIVETKTAPRITLDGIKAAIAETEYFRAKETLTICILTMRNGFHIIGKSACASPENYDQAVGERYAYDDAVRQVWPFEAYLLRETLSAKAAELRGQDDAVRAA